VDEEELTKDWNLTLHHAVCSIFDKFHIMLMKTFPSSTLNALTMQDDAAIFLIGIKLPYSNSGGCVYNASFDPPQALSPRNLS